MKYRRSFIKWATGANLGLTAAGMLVVALGILNTHALPRKEPPHPILDYLEATVLWSYIVATPLCAAAALLLAPARTGRIRINYWLLALWGAFMVWIGTMTTR